ncbi:MAG TPA: TetR/AcrR family transcriptional regulator [Gemmatimonadaceae bacterium]|nr:TetR/AcrR family transcriptional regulator [Gemmatimonadaceae bacterium]
MIAAHPEEPRWRRLPEARPRQILDAAIDVFGESGLAAARLEDIAKRAGVSKGTIYLYFSNKETLFCEMIRQLVGDTIIQAQARAVATSASAVDQLTDYAHSVWQHVRSPMFEKLHRLSIGELRNFPALLEFFQREVPGRNVQAIAGIVRHGIATGEFREMDELESARMLQALIISHGVWCAQREQNGLVAHLTDEEVLEQLLGFFLGAVRKNAGSRPASPAPSAVNKA